MNGGTSRRQFVVTYASVNYASRGRTAARHIDHAHPSRAGSRAAARLRDRAAHSHRVARRTERRGGVAVSGAPETAAQGMGQGVAGYLRDRPRGSRVQADAGRPETAGDRTRELSTGERSHRRGARHRMMSLMSSMAEWLRRVWYLLNRSRLEDALQREMEAHREVMREPVRFGNTLQLRERSRDVWGWTWLDGWLRDVRFAARGLRRTPVFSAVATASLALGLALTTSTVPIVNAYLIRSLPVSALNSN